MPALGQATLPDSISNALRQLEAKPLLEFQNKLVDQLRDTSIQLSDKEELVNGLFEEGNSRKNAPFSSKYAFTAGLIYQLVLDNGAMALYAFEASFQAAERLNNRSDMAIALWQSMNTLAELQLYDEALHYLFKVEAVLQEYNYIGFESIAQKMLQMGSLFFNTGNYDVAIQYYEKALSFRDIEKDKRTLMHAYNTLGLAYQKVKQYEQAVERFEQSYRLGNEIGDRFWSALAYGNTGAVYFEQGRYEEALGHLLFDLKVSQELGVWNSAANACLLVARIYQIQEKNTLAKKYLDLANELDSKNSVRKTRNGIYEQYALLHSDLGNYKAALAYQNAYNALSDTINNDKLQLEQLMLKRKHRFEVQNQERIAKAQTADLQQTLKETTQLNWAFAATSLVLLIGFTLQFKRNSEKLKKQHTTYLEEMRKKEFSLLRKEIQHYILLLQRLKTKEIPLKSFLPESVFWEDFRHKFDDINQHFFSKIKSNHPELTHQDVLWLVLLKLKFTETEIQLLFGSSTDNWAVQVSRKLGVQGERELVQLIDTL